MLKKNIYDSRDIELGTLEELVDYEYFPKDVPRIMIAHEATYVATASTAYIQDFINKIEKAKNLRGFRYIEILSVCTPGWRVPEHIGPQLAKEAVETGYWLLFEYHQQKLKINRKPKFTGLKEFLKKQGRFRDITDDQIAIMEKYLKHRYKIYKSLEEATQQTD